MSTLAFTNNAMFPTTSYVTGSTAFPYSVSVPTITTASTLMNDTSSGNATDCQSIPNVTYLNFSEHMYPRQELLESYMAWGTTENIFKIILTVVAFLGSVCGNLLVILVVYFNPTLRSTINYYLVNLAVADLLIAVLCMWDNPVREITYPFFVLGRTMCRIMPFSHTTCLTASVLTLTAISVDRFYAVVFPLHVRRVPHRSSIVIAAIWVFSASVAFPMFYYRDVVVAQWKDLTEQSCVDFWPRYLYWNEEYGHCELQRPEQKLYLIVVSLALFFLPILVMSLAYALITWKLWVSELPGERNDSATHTQNLAKKKVVKMVCIVLIAFVVCWMPLQVLLIYDLFGHDSWADGRLPLWYEDVMFWTYFLAYFNSALNPLLYGGFNQNYRQGLFNICRKRGPRRGGPQHHPAGDPPCGSSGLPERLVVVVHEGLMQTTTGSTHLPRSPASSCRSSVISRSAAASFHVGSLRAGGRSLRKESTGRRTLLAPMPQSTKSSSSSQYLEMVPCRAPSAPTNGSTVYKNGAV